LIPYLNCQETFSIFVKNLKGCRSYLLNMADNSVEDCVPQNIEEVTEVNDTSVERPQTDDDSKSTSSTQLRRRRPKVAKEETNAPEETPETIYSRTIPDEKDDSIEESESKPQEEQVKEVVEEEQEEQVKEVVEETKEVEEQEVVEEETKEDEEGEEEEEQEEQEEQEQQEEEEEAEDEVVEEEAGEEEAGEEEAGEEEVEEEEVEEADECEVECEVEEEEADEVESVMINNKEYYTTNSTNGVIYNVDENGDITDEVGVFKNGVATFYSS